MVHFVGAGPGAEDLITLRGQRLIEEADVIIYAGSLVNPNLLKYAKENCRIYDSAKMTLEEVISVMRRGESEGRKVVRLHTGDPSLYGAVREQMDVLDELGITYDSCPGVSACFGAAASMNLEYTLPEVSQSLVITRMSGRTKVPEKESIRNFAKHGASMAIYLSSGLLKEVREELIAGGLDPDTPAAIVYRATWEDEMICRCRIADLYETAEKNNITRTAVVLIGEALAPKSYERSKLYDPSFTTGFRKAKEE